MILALMRTGLYPIEEYDGGTNKMKEKRACIDWFGHLQVVGNPEVIAER